MIRPMKIRPMAPEEVGEKCGQFGRRQLILGCAALAVSEYAGWTPPEGATLRGDTLTLADVLRATDALRAANVPAHGDGNYTLFVAPEAREQLNLDFSVCNLDYRARTTAWSVYAHERRRLGLGLRAEPVTSDEVLARVERIYSTPLARLPVQLGVEVVS